MWGLTIELLSYTRGERSGRGKSFTTIALPTMTRANTCRSNDVFEGRISDYLQSGGNRTAYPRG
jgi:hypothetical protein